MKKGSLASLLCILICIQTGFAQKTEPGSGGRLFARLYLPGFIDPMDANATAGFEYKFSTRWSGTFDAGGIYASLYYNDNSRAAGFILRPGVRMYFNKRNRLFLEGQFHYKDVTYTSEGWVNRNVVNGVPGYQQYMTYKYRKQFIGTNFMIGFKKGLGKKPKLFFEFYGGIGIKYKHEGPGEDDDIRPDSPQGGDFYLGNLLPTLPMGVRFVWKLY